MKVSFLISTDDGETIYNFDSLQEHWQGKG